MVNGVRFHIVVNSREAVDHKCAGAFFQISWLKQNTTAGDTSLSVKCVCCKKVFSNQFLPNELFPVVKTPAKTRTGDGSGSAAGPAAPARKKFKLF